MILAKVFLSLGSAIANSQSKGTSMRVATNEGFWKYHQL
jgi:hypothetical protein